MRTNYRISGNFHQLLTFTLEIFGKGNLPKQAIFTKSFTADFNFTLETFTNSPLIQKFPLNKTYSINNSCKSAEYNEHA